MSDLNAFYNGYITCALWSSTDNADDTGGQPLDSNYSDDDVREETKQKLMDECRKFMDENAADLELCFNHETIAYSVERAGNDFWLDHNGHGCGFDDRGLGDVGERLSKAARAYGEVYLYVGDDGKIDS